MTDVSSTFLARWRSGRHVGAQRPTVRVLVRRGEFSRGYHAWDGPTVNADIYGESRSHPWSPTWTPAEDWKEVPGVLGVQFDQDFDQDGLATGSITVENILYRELVGAMGRVYHLIERGALTPIKGYKGPGQPMKVPPQNEWYGVLAENSQVKVFQGYGDALEPTFVGFIDRVNPTSSPNRIELSVRDTGGKILADEHIFGWNKSRQLPEPVVFKARKNGKPIGADASASSSRDGHPPRFVADTSGATYWISGDRHDEDLTEWVQIRIPRGRYKQIIVEPHYAGMEMYVGIYAKSRLGSAHGGSYEILPTLDGEEHPQGWLHVGKGDVPGETNGGWAYVRRIATTQAKATRVNLPGEIHVGDDSIIRLGFRRLSHIRGDTYRAGVVRLAAIKEPTIQRKTTNGTDKTVFVDDPADIVRCLLRWAGFKDWKVDDTGAELDGAWNFNRSSTYIDAIKRVRDSTGFVFYMEGPSDDPDDLGLPVFRDSNVHANAITSTGTVRDTDLLTDMQATLTDEPKSYIIRVRGRLSKGGLRLGEQRERALMSVYRPPWSSGRRMARIIRRHAVHNDPKLKTQEQVELFARLIAFEQALLGATASIEVPGTPQFDLDDHIAVRDTTTGIVTRLYVARRSTEAQYGQEAKWTASFAGALIDHIDVAEVRSEVRRLLRKSGELRTVKEVL